MGEAWELRLANDHAHRFFLVLFLGLHHSNKCMKNYHWLEPLDSHQSNTSSLPSQCCDSPLGHCQTLSPPPQMSPLVLYHLPQLWPLLVCCCHGNQPGHVTGHWVAPGETVKACKKVHVHIIVKCTSSMLFVLQAMIAVE